jgi:hypothetical protein
MKSVTMAANPEHIRDGCPVAWESVALGRLTRGLLNRWHLPDRGSEIILTNISNLARKFLIMLL